LAGKLNFCYHAGLVRSDVKFFWYDGTRLGVENWQNNQPETSGIGNECVKLTVTGWASVQCSEIQAVLCEKGLSCSNCVLQDLYSIVEQFDCFNGRRFSLVFVNSLYHRPQVID
jgi:hypothetical protein